MIKLDLSEVIQVSTSRQGQVLAKFNGLQCLSLFFFANTIT